MKPPYQIGDRVRILGCHPFVVTEVLPVGFSWEYKAEWRGSSFVKYWKCDRYSHMMLDRLEAV
jgi:hypothetical protein